jgi:hypothetical protein
MAVAIWDHRPPAAEILERRLSHGWTPTASALKEGERVLGYAACAVVPPHRSRLER